MLTVTNPIDVKHIYSWARELQASRHQHSQHAKHSQSQRQPTFHTSQPPIATQYITRHYYTTNQHTPAITAPSTIFQTASFVAKLKSSKAIMYYLIHTPHHPRPYLSTVSFIANDFANWGCRVTCHANNSAYITEIRYQEKRNRPGSRRIELMEVWAKEVLARKSQQHQPQAITSQTDTLAARKARASAFAQDFVSGLSAFGTPSILHLPKYKMLRCQNLQLSLPEPSLMIPCPSQHTPSLSSQSTRASPTAARTLLAPHSPPGPTPRSPSRIKSPWNSGSRRA